MAESFDAMIKFRCSRELTARLSRIISHPEHMRTLPNLARKVMEAFADQEEKRLKLAPITQHEIERFLEKASKKEKETKTSRMRKPRF